jgi:ATP-dependent DNA helicase RecQ
MQAYVDLPSGHMEFLIRALDGDPVAMAPRTMPLLPAATRPVLVQEAVAFLKRTSLPIAARQKWPTGGMPRYGVSGRIAAALMNEEGRALCVWGDVGWGGQVRHGKYAAGCFDDALVDACARLFREWNPQPAPMWVTCVPSLRHPLLVRGFAERLAHSLGLPFHAALLKTDARPEQKTMANSTQQARNLDGSLTLDPAVQVPESPVLLVDDMVHSRWTLTVAGWLLRQGGSGQVWPLALAQVGSDQ